MEDWILVIVAAVVCLFLLVGGMAKILGKCSRQEEEEGRMRGENGRS